MLIIVWRYGDFTVKYMFSRNEGLLSRLGQRTFTTKYHLIVPDKTGTKERIKVG